MTDPTVEQGGWAAGSPGSSLRRGRSPLLGAIALLLLVGGAVASAVGIYLIARDAGPADDRVLARGTVTSLSSPERSTTTFEASEPGDVTVWLELGGPDNVRSSIVAGTTCELDRADGSSAEIVGRVQHTVVATDGHETIGTAAAGEGSNEIACHHVPFGTAADRAALEEQHDFVVELGTPGDGLGGWWLVIPGIAAVLLGIPLAIRWRAGNVRPV